MDSLEVAQRLVKSIDNNAENSPHLGVDAKNEKIAVVGDPSNIDTPNRDYKLKFVYQPDEITQADIPNLKKEDDDTYSLTVHYKNKRIKPLFKTRVISRLIEILYAINVFQEDGYTSDNINESALEVLINKIEILTDLAYIVLGVDKKTLEYVEDVSLVDFFLQLVENEKNLIREAFSFLLPRSEEPTDQEKK